MYRIIRIKRLYTLRVELKLLRKLQENRSLQLTGGVMATGEAIITGELLATGQAKVQSVQTSRDGGIVASQDLRFFVGRLAGSAGSPLCLFAA